MNDIKNFIEALDVYTPTAEEIGDEEGFVENDESICGVDNIALAYHRHNAARRYERRRRTVAKGNAREKIWRSRLWYDIEILGNTPSERTIGAVRNGTWGHKCPWWSASGKRYYARIDRAKEEIFERKVGDDVPTMRSIKLELLSRELDLI